MLVPALLTRMSSRPNASSAASISARHAACPVTSASTAAAFAPSASSAFTAAAFLPALRPAIASAAPACASPVAMPRPMPPLPPVTIATRPLRSNGLLMLFPFRFSRGYTSRLQHGRSAAVQIDAGAGDIARRFRREKRDRVGDFLGAADAPQRYVLRHVGVELLHRDAGLGCLAFVLPRAHQADAYRVLQDLVRRKLLRQRLGERQPRCARDRGRHRFGAGLLGRSEERRVGKECRSRWS